jgi:hypothetical protein
MLGTKRRTPNAKRGTLSHWMFPDGDGTFQSFNDLGTAFESSFSVLSRDSHKKRCLSGRNKTDPVMHDHSG